MKPIPTALTTLLTMTLLYQSLAPPQSALSPSLHTTWIGETEKNRSRKS